MEPKRLKSKYLPKETLLQITLQICDWKEEWFLFHIVQICFFYQL